MALPMASEQMAAAPGGMADRHLPKARIAPRESYLSRSCRRTHRSAQQKIQ